MAQDFNLKAYTVINLTQMIRPDWALNQASWVTVAR